MSTVKELILKIDSNGNVTGKFIEEKPNLLKFEALVAERKAFLSRQKLMYKCKVKIDDDKKLVRFFEILTETGSGISSGGYDSDDISPGFGFKVEKTKYISGGREGSIEEQSVLFGKKYNYEFDYKKIREEIKNIVQDNGYTFEYVLRESSL